MQFLILMNVGKANVMRSEAAATRECGEAPAMAEGLRSSSRTAPVRLSAHRMSVVDGPYPETKQ